MDSYDMASKRQAHIARHVIDTHFEPLFHALNGIL
jgi:hypothetical protein